MKTIKQASIFPVYTEFIPERYKMQVGVIYISREYKTASHLCLCGCQCLTVTPLNENGWTLTDSDGLITMTPSIGNFQFECKSHYIITKGIANFV